MSKSENNIFSHNYTTRRHCLTLALLVILVSGFYLFLIEMRVGYLGSEYPMWISRFLEGLLFFNAQGLNYPLYSAIFCGAMPSYANPQSSYYSIPQLLTFIFPVWTAIRMTIVIYIFLAAYGMWKIAINFLEADVNIALIFCLSFLSSGFLPAHLIIGHLNYLPFNLLPLLIYVIFRYPFTEICISSPLRGRICGANPGGDNNKRSQKQSLPIRERPLEKLMILAYSTYKLFTTVNAYIFRQTQPYLLPSIIIGLLLASLVYSGSHVIPIIFLLSFPIIWTSFILVKAKIAKPFIVFRRIILGLISAFALSLSKLVAVISFMSNYPRGVDYEQFSFLEALSIIFQQIIFGVVISQKTEYPLLSEQYSVISPVLIILSTLFLLNELKKENRKNLLLFVSSIFLFLIFFSGIKIFPESWSFISLRINTRLTAALILPILILGTACKRIININKFILFLSALLPLIILISPTKEYYETKDAFKVDFSSLSQFYNDLKFFHGDRNYFAENVSVPKEWNPFIFQRSDMLAIQDKKIVADCNEALYYNKEPAKVLVDGSAFNVQDAYLNLLDPRCQVYPDENNCSPGDRFKESDLEAMQRILSYKNPLHSISKAQFYANKITEVSLVFVITIFIVYGLLRGLKGTVP